MVVELPGRSTGIGQAAGAVEGAASSVRRRVRRRCAAAPLPQVASRAVDVGALAETSLRRFRLGGAPAGMVHMDGSQHTSAEPANDRRSAHGSTAEPS